jgi:hypothetical protein
VCVCVCVCVLEQLNDVVDWIGRVRQLRLPALVLLEGIIDRQVRHQYLMSWRKGKAKSREKVKTKGCQAEEREG